MAFDGFLMEWRPKPPGLEPFFDSSSFLPWAFDFFPRLVALQASHPRLVIPDGTPCTPFGSSSQSVIVSPTPDPAMNQAVRASRGFNFHVGTNATSENRRGPESHTLSGKNPVSTSENPNLQRLAGMQPLESRVPPDNVTPLSMPSILKGFLPMQRMSARTQ